jgi:hypothetical protein
VVLRGTYVSGHDDAIRRRIHNVAARAGKTQPERRIVSVEPDGEGLEVIATSQKLAHRIVHELKKAFGGRPRTMVRPRRQPVRDAEWTSPRCAARRVRERRVAPPSATAGHGRGRADWHDRCSFAHTAEHR